MPELKRATAPDASNAEGASPTASSRSTALIPALLFLACLAAQLYLIFFKSFNWDEFLHFGQVYQLRAGTLIQPFQVLHSRILWWAPAVSDDLLTQMFAARIFIWSAHLLTLICIYGIALKFTNSWNSFFAAFAYSGAGYVFTQGFSIRADPLVAATLMSALFLMARTRLALSSAIVIGVLIGIAGMMTFKAIFYAPCFAGLAWLRAKEVTSTAQFLAKMGVIVSAAVLSFSVIYFYHRSGLAAVSDTTQSAPDLSLFLRWLNIDWQFAGYIGREIVYAPLFVISLLLAPLGWRKAGLGADAKIALSGFIAPLAVFLFYRNTFPYFFVFILAPAAIAIAPVLGLARERWGSAFLAILLSGVPLTLTILEPRDVIDRQRALIDYVHQEYPEKTGYLDYSGMIADYPRILKYLTSGNGIRLYNEQGDAIIGREIDRGNVPFIIANNPAIWAALKDRPFPDSFLADDLDAMRGNYVQQWGALWREGKLVPAGTGNFDFNLRRGGVFVLQGAPLIIDGKLVARGQKIALSEGRHRISGSRNAPATLWRGERLPGATPSVPTGNLFTAF